VRRRYLRSLLAPRVDDDDDGFVFSDEEQPPSAGDDEEPPAAAVAPSPAVGDNRRWGCVADRIGPKLL